MKDGIAELTEWRKGKGVMELRGQVRFQMEFGNEKKAAGGWQEGKMVTGPSTPLRFASDDRFKRVAFGGHGTPLQAEVIS